MAGSARIVHGNALDLPLPDSSVDLVVTSPPYFGLRSYQDGGEHYAGQIGSEATPAEFVDALIVATAEMVRVLKPSGSIWVNLGDKYAGAGYGNNAALNAPEGRQRKKYVHITSVPAKSLIGVPWRYAIRCIDDLGLILRAEVIWSKPNRLPESVTDRVRRSHETWFHFTKMQRYYSAVDEIREAHTSHSTGLAATFKRPHPSHDLVPGQSMTQHRADRPDSGQSPLGKLPGSVWTIPTQPLTVPASLGIGHFAAFPMEWPRRIIRGWSPAGVCVACGEGRRPVLDAGERIGVAPRGREGTQALGTKGWRGSGGYFDPGADSWKRTDYRITGYACDCPDTTAPTTPGVVLDPFGGTGTTALVAKVLGREGISVDLSEDYCRLAEWRTTDPDQIASAMQVAKPAKQVEGQWDLFAPMGEVS